MKKCKDCDREIDKYAIACQYCIQLRKEKNGPVASEENKKTVQEKVKE